MTSIAEKYRNYSTLLWFDDVFSSEPKLVQSRFDKLYLESTVQFLLNGTISKRAKNFEAADKTFVQLILNVFYVDDFCREEFSEEKSIEFCKKVKLRFIEGHFH